MAISIKSITTGRARSSPRILLLGTEKVGKSTWAAGAPNPVFIPIQGERGVDEIDAAKFPVAKSIGDVMEALGSLATEEHDFKTACLDSASALEPLIFDQVCADHGLPKGSIEKVEKGFGKGYVAALSYWREIQQALDYLREDCGMGAILIGHVKVKSFNDPATEPYDQWQFDIQSAASALWQRWADATLFATTKAFARAVGQGDKKVVHAQGNGERVLYTERRPAHPGGTRYRNIPFELPLHYQAFADAVAASA